MNFKNYIPKKLKLQVKLLIRSFKDLGIKEKFAVKTEKQLSYNHEISIVQEIKKNHHFENKLVNIDLGIQSIQDVTIYPNQIFSFWKMVPKPSAKNNFQQSRNIIDGKLSEDIGGGLCQLSSIIYHCALISGLKITERHNHSVDLYEEKDRFTPLGSDATVVYGYKDLRFQNNFNFPIQIQLKIKDFNLKCSFLSPENIQERDLEFVSKTKGNGVEVETYAIFDHKKTLLNTAFYLKLK
ncbi:MAG: VanW family protein [Flavobacteriia bacterium]|jgi:vancomycin resistance protein VanW